MASIKLVLTSVLQTAKQGTDLIKVPECNQVLEQLVVPHNDFFSAQFLIPFAVAGMHQVTEDPTDILRPGPVGRDFSMIFKWNLLLFFQVNFEDPS